MRGAGGTLFPLMAEERLRAVADGTESKSNETLLSRRKSPVLQESQVHKTRTRPDKCCGGQGRRGASGETLRSWCCRWGSRREQGLRMTSRCTCRGRGWLVQEMVGLAPAGSMSQIDQMALELQHAVGFLIPENNS